jgi:hypothetical protein
MQTKPFDLIELILSTFANQVSFKVLFKFHNPPTPPRRLLLAIYFPSALISCFIFHLSPLILECVWTSVCLTEQASLSFLSPFKEHWSRPLGHCSALWRIVPDWKRVKPWGVTGIASERTVEQGHRDLTEPHTGWSPKKEGSMITARWREMVHRVWLAGKGVRTKAQGKRIEPWER